MFENVGNTYGQDGKKIGIKYTVDESENSKLFWRENFNMNQSLKI